ncbi:MAG: ACT domain-containing protein, partial [Christensenellaceae bacterium]
QWFKKELKEENIVKGKEMLEKEAKRQGYALHELLNKDWLSVLYKRFTLNSQEDMFAAVGYGAITVNQILFKLIEQYKIANKIDTDVETVNIIKKSSKGAQGDITVKGSTGLAVRFAKCCNPVPGDDIVGYITRGRGVCVHTKDCKNLREMGVDEERLIDVAWVNNQKSSYNVEIQIIAHDRPGLMVEISQTMYNTNRDITAINARSSKNGLASISLRSNITSVDDLNDLINKLQSLKGVQEVFRVNY